MQTQQSIRRRLETIAAEILQTPGMYHELFSRLYSERVQRIIDTAHPADADLIQRMAEQDPDYAPVTDLTDAADMDLLATASRTGPLFNPAWDVQY